MHEGMQPPTSTAAPLSSRVTLAGTRIGASAFLSREERQALESAALPSRSVRAGQDLVREGEPADRLYLIMEGWACRYQTTRDGMRQISAMLVPGDTANVDSLTFDSPGYGVRALTEIKVLAIPCDRALALTTQHAGVARTFLFLALTDNAILSQWALCMGRLSARQRLAHLLCELSARLDPEEGNESSFELPVTQEQLADALGLTSVHVNRTMQQLRTEGLITTGNRAITIPDVVRLRSAGGFDPGYLHIRSDNAEGAA
ncbi:MAG: CRP-like cAMP-binding protein [Sphingomonas echinoides]|jgi:CRP-like cAMP-binding protein